MGYRIAIGERMQGVLDQEIGEEVYVNDVVISGSPNVINTALHSTGSNHVHVSYSGVWFLDDSCGVGKVIPIEHGHFEITEEIEKGLTDCITNYTGDREGFGFSLLTWMHWWVRWSLDNCSSPVMVLT